SRRRHTRSKRDWSSDVCSSDLNVHFFLLYVLIATTKQHQYAYVLHNEMSHHDVFQWSSSVPPNIFLLHIRFHKILENLDSAIQSYLKTDSMTVAICAFPVVRPSKHLLFLSLRERHNNIYPLYHQTRPSLHV